MSADDLSRHPLHLGLGATAVKQPEFTGAMDWYEAYGQRHDADGAEGRLVSQHRFDASWAMWEMHPQGSEVVVCVAGAMKMLQQQPDGSVLTTALTAGQHVVNAPGVWHTADVADTATALFITAGLGTQHRPR